jgi:hypothetical protein
MANSLRCIAALNKAAGRELTPEELQGMFDRIKRTARDIAAGRVEAPTGPHNTATPQGVMMAAAEIAARDIQAEAVRKQRNTHMQVARMADRQAQVRAMVDAGINPVDAVRRTLVNDADGRSDQFSLEARVAGTQTELQRKIQDTWDAFGNDWLGFVQDKDKMKALITEMKGQDSGNPLAKKGAKAWLDTAEQARQWYNEVGGDVGHLEDWGFPQHHSQERVARAGLEQWIADIMPMIDRSKYIDTAGNPMDAAQISDFLAGAFDTISTNGANKIEPGAFRGNGARANRHADERQIHFKDAESVINYWQKYGEKTFPDILLGHIEGMAKDIAFLEHFGPNPDATFRTLRDQAAKEAALADRTNIDKINSKLSSLDRLYDYAAGKTKPLASQNVARFFESIRNLNVAGKLGSAVWSSIYGDKVTLEAISRVNNLPALQNWYNELRMFDPTNGAERRALQRQGLMLDHMRNAMFKYGDDLGKSSWTGKLANGVMRASGMGIVNEWRRGSFGLTMMSAIGHEVSAKGYADIGPQDMRLLNSYGITEGDWKVWKLAQLEDLGHGNDKSLTPEAISRIPDDALKSAGLTPKDRRAAVVKFLGALTSESQLAVIEPGWSERAAMIGGLQRGNIRDELTRSFWQFKTFPITQFHRMLDVALSRPTMGGKAGYLMAIPIMQTIAGAMMIQTQESLAGKDPRPMDDWKFWAAAFIKGGSLGIYGDFLFSQSGTTRYGTGPLEALAGPTIGTLGDFVGFSVQAGNALKTGDASHFGAKTLNLTKGLIPGGNLWYTKAAIDHIIFQNAQEMLSPGYLSTMRSRTQNEFGNDWWWAPGEFAPERAPDMGTALESNN